MELVTEFDMKAGSTGDEESGGFLEAAGASAIQSSKPPAS